MQKYQICIDGTYVDASLGREDGMDSIRECLRVRRVWITTGGVTGNPFAMR